MVKFAFDHVTTWVFDLDHTLYPANNVLFDQISPRMTNYISNLLAVDTNTATTLRNEYWETYGATLAGLIERHDIDPIDFLKTVHDIDFSVLSADPNLAQAIKSLPGRKIVYTNGYAPYAERVLSARGLSGVMDAIYGVEDAEFKSKPSRQAFEMVIAKDGFTPTSAALFEDSSNNLHVPHALGMKTVYVGETRSDQSHIHHQTDDLTGFLSQLV